MIKMKALKTFGFAGANEGPVKRGREFSARDMKRAQELEAHGLAYRVAGKAEPHAPLNKMEPAAPQNKAAAQGPLDLAGGRIGATEPAPLSPAVRQPRRRRSINSEDDSRS